MSVRKNILLVYQTFQRRKKNVAHQLESENLLLVYSRLYNDYTR